MKRLVLLLALLPLWAGAQEKDSADIVVDRYLKMMNYDGLPHDSTLVLETTVTFHGSPDTFLLRRWYAPPAMMRVEVWHGDTLTEGLCTNGDDRHREYSRHQGWWNDIASNSFHEKMAAYDFRGELFNRQVLGSKLTYRGTVTTKGQRLQVVSSERKQYYTRYYMFEARSGLLVLMQEKDEMEEAKNQTERIKKTLRIKPIEYKVVHEYQPLGECLVPSQESYMRDGLLTIMETKAHLVPRDNMLFNQD